MSSKATARPAAPPVQRLNEGVAARLLAVLETAVDGVVLIDNRGRVETFNRAAQRMFGYAADEVVGRNVSMLMPEPHRSGHDRYLSEYLRTGHAKIIGIGREAVGRRKDGSTFPIELAVSEVRAGGQRTFAGVVRDLSEAKRLEREILDASEREQRRIAGELHDGLCQELAGIAYLTATMQQRVAGGGAVSADEAKQVAGLLGDAVASARLMARGLQPVEPSPAGLAVALRRLAEEATRRMGVRCEFRCPRPVEVYSAVAATHAYRIAQEAVRDAAGTGRARRVGIGLARRGDAVTLTVSDDGLPPAAAGRFREDIVRRLTAHRLQAIGASLGVEPGRGGVGVRVRCDFPDQPPAAATPLAGT